MLRQLSYLSAATTECDEAALAAILESASKANAERQVTGLLVYADGVFFQILEGPRDCVEAAMQIVRRDPRHHSIRIVHDEAIAARDFEHWHMGYATGDGATLQRLHGASWLDAAIIPDIVAGLTFDLPRAVLGRMSRAA
jgi:hypothetical protein